MRFGTNQQVLFEGGDDTGGTGGHHHGDDDGNVQDGSGGSVNLEGHNGADIFLFNTVADSTSTTFDTIERFDPVNGDTIDLPVTVTDRKSVV